MLEILAILASSEKNSSSIKAAAESYIEILEVKVARASKRGRMLQEMEKSPNSANSL